MYWKGTPQNANASRNGGVQIATYRITNLSNNSRQEYMTGKFPNENARIVLTRAKNGRGRDKVSFLRNHGHTGALGSWKYATPGLLFTDAECMHPPPQSGDLFIRAIQDASCKQRCTCTISA